MMHDDSAQHTPRGGERPSGTAWFGFLIFFMCGAVYSLLAWRAPGAGSDPDAWRLLLAGLDLWETGRYVPSRPPGFPAMEVLAAATAPLGILGLKLLTSWAGAWCVTATCFLMVPYDLRATRVAAILLAVCPAMLIASTMTMDHVWMLGLVLGGLMLAQRGQGLAAGLVIGLAAGFRITALLALPAVVLILPAGTRRWSGITRLAAGALPVAALMYGAVLLACPMLFEEVHRPPLAQLVPCLERLPGSLFGWGGFAALAVAAVATIMWPGSDRPTRRHAVRSPFPPLPRAALGAMVVCFLLAYALAPHEPLYLLPVLPVLFILLAPRLNATVAVVLAAAMLFCNYRDVRASGLVCGVVAQDMRDRARLEHLVGYFLAHPPEPPALVIAGYREPLIRYESRTGRALLPSGVRVEYLLREEMFRLEDRSGMTVYCLKDMVGECRKRGFDPLAAGAKVWWPPPEVFGVERHLARTSETP